MSAMGEGPSVDDKVMDVAIKIRGIYATALTRLFLDRGLTIVSASQSIVDRFGLGEKIASFGSADVQIEDMEGGQGILMEGRCEPVAHVTGLIREVLFDVICRKGAQDRMNVGVEVEFPYLSKSRLDQLRNFVVPTLHNHHRLRIIASEYLDLMEKNLSLHPEGRDTISRDLEESLIWRSYAPGKEIGIEHVKPDGRVFFLSEGEIVEIHPKEREMVLKRKKFKGRNRYDGLNVRKEEGDYAISRLKEGDWFYRHTYFRQGGRLIGTYFNINTLIEFYPDKIRYVDLEIDVIQWPDGRSEIIDVGELEKQFESGHLGAGLKSKAESTAYELKRILS